MASFALWAGGAYVFPNILGVMTDIYGGALLATDKSGAFQSSPVYNSGSACGTTGADLKAISLEFKAQNSNILYGGSSTVQTASLRSLALIRAY